MEVVTEKTTKNSVPKGYKRTEVGVIPKDWGILKFSEAFSFLRTGTNSRSDLSDNGEVYYIHYGDIHAKWENILDFKNNKVPLIGSEKVKGLPFLEEGDLIIADASEDYEGVGASVEVKNLNDKKAVAGLHTILLRSDDVLADNYKAYITRIDGVREELLKVCTGTTVYGLSKSKLKEVQLPLPPFEEQQAIAETLSDVDALIAELDALIEKKQQVKKGAMQQLLTGKKRLPGFVESKGHKKSEVGKIPKDWKVYQQKEVVEYINGRAYSKDEWEERGIPVVRLQNLTGSGDEYYYSTMNLPEKKYMYPGDLIFMWSASFGPYIWEGPKAIFHYHIWKINCDEKYVSKTFYYYKLLELTEALKQNTSGSTMLHLTKTGMEKYKIALPSNVEEQKAIAQILSDMDEEIRSLQAKRDKYKKIKQGMMQELLTGRTRLV